MDERFVALAALVRAPDAVPLAQTRAPEPEPDPNVSKIVAAFAHAPIVNELALMRLAAIEAFERSTARLLRALATDVLARELELKPADLSALIESALASYAEHEPIEILVAPGDAERVRCALPSRVDANLQPGDLVVRVRDGAFESPFAFRAETAFACVVGGEAA